MKPVYAIGLGSDGTFRYFVDQAARHDAEIVAVDLRDVVASGDWRLSIPDDGCGSRLGTSQRTVDLDPAGSYFCRLIDLSAIEPDRRLAARWRSLATALSAWLDHVPGLVVNRPGAWADNGSKPLHEARLGRAGFSVPESVTSSDAERLRVFAAAGPTVVKALSGVRATTRLVGPTDFDGFTAARGPVHLQRFVAGDDIRAHVCGARVHAQRISSPEVDYRAADAADLDMSPADLPAWLISQIVGVTRQSGLAFAGWDMKIDPGGAYWVLEANPMPGYDWYDRRLDGALTASLLDLLDEGDR